MSEVPIRRGQVITPFGPGSISVSHRGDVMLMGVLDKWYYNGYEKSKNVEEFKKYEPRLAKILDVDYFMLPPDFRIGKSGERENSNLTLPMLRFPQWHYCTRCKTLRKFDTEVRRVERCECGGEYVQVPFVTICSRGHIDDFPWREWVHENLNPTCNGKMQLVSVGGTNLSTMEVRCECKARRSLFGTTSKNTNNEESDVTYLAQHLDKHPETFYKCTGRKTWFGGNDDSEPCNEYPIAVLKNSSNIYFPETISAIYLPGEMSKEVELILKLFETETGRKYLNTAFRMDNKNEQIQVLRELFEDKLERFNDDNIWLAINYWKNPSERITQSYVENIEEQLRKEEYRALINEIDTEDLKIVNEWNQEKYEEDGIEKYVRKINLITRLRETKVLYGFSRLNAPQGELSSLKIKKGKAMLFKNPFDKENNWLPANVIYGEGIFIELNDTLLDAWEKENKEMNSRFKQLKERYEKLLKQGLVKKREITPRLVLIHTLAHLIINELVFECGYSTSSIRERLYVQKNEEDQANGFLIYTASGDSDGTLGGLVRMGKKENLFPILERAINKAKWCSSDPICTDIGEMSGQGFQRLNMSACHNCTYLPETSCEEFNMLLDRGLVVGTPTNPQIGFFTTEPV